MLKRSITYTNFDDKKVTGEYYFNLSKSDIIRLQVSVPGGLEEYLKRIVAEENPEEIVSRFEWLILKAYGEKSEDGQLFVKTEEISQNFRHTAAYDTLLYELMTDTTKAAAFVTGIIPQDVAEQISGSTPQDKTEAARQMLQDAPHPPLPPGLKP